MKIVTLKELKLLLGIPEGDTSQDKLLELLLAAAIDFVIERTQNLFTKDKDGHIILPGGVKLAISMMIQAVLAMGVGKEGGGQASLIESERVGPMQQTFRNPADIWDSGGQYGRTAPWFSLLKPYYRFQFIPARRRKKHASPHSR